MATPITWKNINTPSFSDSNELMRAGVDTITKGLDRLKGAGETLSENRLDEAQQLRDYNTQDAINQINALKTLEGHSGVADQYTPDALAARNLDVAKVMGAFGDRKTDIRDTTTADFEYSELLRTRAEKPILDEYNSLVAQNKHDEAAAFQQANAGMVQDWSGALNNAEQAGRADEDHARKLVVQGREDTTYTQDQTTENAIGKIGTYTSLADLTKFTQSPEYAKMAATGKGSDITTALQDHRKYLIKSAGDEINLASTIKNQNQKAMYEGLAQKIDGVFNNQMDGDYNTVTEAITELKNGSEYQGMTPDTRTKVDEYITGLTAKLTNTPAPVQKKIDRQIQALPTSEYGKDDSGNTVTFRQEEAAINTERTTNANLYAKIPDIYKPGRPAMLEGDVPAAIADGMNVAGDVWFSTQGNQEDIASAVARVKTYAKDELNTDIPLETIVQAFRTAYLIDVDPETDKGEFRLRDVKKAVKTAVAELNLARENITTYTNKETEINLRESAYNDKLIAAKNKITDDEQSAYLGAQKIKNTK